LRGSGRRFRRRPAARPTMAAPKGGFMLGGWCVLCGRHAGCRRLSGWPALGRAVQSGPGERVSQPAAGAAVPAQAPRYQRLEVAAR
jgi:hypothetical protein